jgi:hypothetical protein
MVVYPHKAPRGVPTKMQTSGRSWLMMVIRSSRGSYVMLSDVVYGPQASRTIVCSKSKTERIGRVMIRRLILGCWEKEGPLE